MDVPHYTIDFTDSFRKNVVDNFVDEYIEGKTPNPCVRCNSFIKWDTFIEQADILGAKYIATGHYAQIGQNNNGYFIKEGVDKRKDQSYVLWGIPKETLSKTILPLGDLTKEEVRQIARDNKLETAEEPESMEICFIADNNYKRFLKDYASDKMDKMIVRIDGLSKEVQKKEIQEMLGKIKGNISKAKTACSADPKAEVFRTRYAGVLQGDLGKSFIHGEPVFDVIAERLPISSFYGLLTFFFIYLVCVPLGIAKAMKHNSWFDNGSSVFIFTGYAIPGYVLGALMMVFLAARWEW